MKVKDCVIGLFVAAAIFASANADTPAATSLVPQAGHMSAQAFAATRVFVGEVLDIMGTLAAFAKQLQRN